MRQIILFIIIFVLGAVSYSFLNPFLSSFLNQNNTDEEMPEVVPTEEAKPKIETPTPVVVKKEAKKVTLDETGALHDGPFQLMDKNGEPVSGTVEIIRSPEETLLQFKNTTFTHSDDSSIYFATDLKATKYLNIGPAKLNQGVSVYGMPLDADLSIYTYLLVYNTETQSVECYARLE